MIRIILLSEKYTTSQEVNEMYIIQKTFKLKCCHISKYCDEHIDVIDRSRVHFKVKKKFLNSKIFIMSTYFNKK